MYITTTVRTLFPVSSLPPSFRHKYQLNAKIEARENKRNSLPVIEPVQPLYTTEAAVTAAIISNTLVGFALTRYSEAKSYQAALKAMKKLKK